MRAIEKISLKIYTMRMTICAYTAMPRKPGQCNEFKEAQKRPGQDGFPLVLLLRMKTDHCNDYAEIAAVASRFKRLVDLKIRRDRAGR